jgi:hypothetical protein
MEILSARLGKTIRTYCLEMDDQGLDDLGKDVRNGALSWFPDEFADAIRAGAFTPPIWEKLVDVSVDEEEILDEYLRLVWSNVAPDRPYPLDG